MNQKQEAELLALIRDIDEFGYGKIELIWDQGEIVKIYAGKSYKPIYTDLCDKQATIKDWKKGV